MIHKHKYKYVHASYRTFGRCSDFKQCDKCGHIKGTFDWLNLLLIVLATTLILFAYTAIEPIIFAYTGFGFVWDYNPYYEPILFRK